VTVQEFPLLYRLTYLLPSRPKLRHSLMPGLEKLALARGHQKYQDLGQHTTSALYLQSGTGQRE
jgi:hypothetical protein